MIAIIIVGYNSRKDLRDCLKSIAQSTYKKYKIIYVDNSSIDGSAAYVKKFHRDVVVIKNKNTGYAGGNNVGVRYALRTLKSDFIFILNPDTVVEKNCLKTLLEAGNKRTIIQPLILLRKNKRNTQLINTAGSYLNFLGFSYCGMYRERASQATSGAIAIASGAATLIPASIFKKIGYFDEHFFMYHEDVDFFWRARRAGFNIRLAAKAFVWHKYSFSKNRNKMFYSERNRLLFLYKNFSQKYRILILPMMILNELVVLLYSLMNGWLLQKIRSYLSAASLIFHKKVTRIKKMPKNDGDLKGFIGAPLEFDEIHSVLFRPYNALLKSYWRLIKWLI